MNQPITPEHEDAVRHHLRVGGYDPYDTLFEMVVISWELDYVPEDEATKQLSN